MLKKCVHVCVCKCMGGQRATEAHHWVEFEESKPPTNPIPPLWASPLLTESPPPTPSPGLGLCGHLPLLMKIHGFISISGVISETAKHKTGLYPRRPGEPDRMTWLSALAEQGSCGAWKWDLVGVSEVGGSDGEDLMFGLATMAAVCYLSKLLGTNEAFCRDGGGEERAWGGGEKENRGGVYHYTPTSHTTLTSSAHNSYANS